jgi:uncharacterized integral membrane protein
MARFKVILIVVLAVLLVIVILQNTETVDTRLLFVTVSMPRAALLGFAVLLGFVLGLLTDLWIGRKKPQR